MARYKQSEYVADFETTVDEQRTRVWLWGLVNISTESFEYGIDIESFIEKVSRLGCKVYFHNLKFDGNFIIYYLLTNGFEHTTERFPNKNQFTTLISDMGLFYSITVCFDKGRTVTFLDSLKQIAMPVADMPKAFGLDIEKLEIDYEVDRNTDYVVTDHEIQYVKHDCLVVAKALKHLHSQGLRKMTAASNALNNYKIIVTKNKFDYDFPQLSATEDIDCRKAYKGGWTYLNHKYKDILVGKGMVYDVNSMYPWAMKTQLLPRGIPKYFQGKYQYSKSMPLYIQCLSCCMKLKQNRYPSIQIKGSIRFLETEYLVEVNEPVVLTLTSVDYELLLENYDIWDVEYHGGYMFMGSFDMFSDYIDKWYAVKEKSDKEGNKALKYTAKLMLNSLYGKFGSNPNKRSKYPYYDKEHDVVKYEFGPQEYTKGGYVPVAAFITSYARDKIIRAANSCGERFVYADTDSIHILGDEEPDIEIDSYRLGAFKLESTFDIAKYHRTKCYIESKDGELDKKCAGLPKKARDLFGFDTMEVGSVFNGKLVPVNVPGGTVLINRAFTIK